MHRDNQENHHEEIVRMMIERLNITKEEIEASTEGLWNEDKVKTLVVPQQLTQRLKMSYNAIFGMPAINRKYPKYFSFDECCIKNKLFHEYDRSVENSALNMKLAKVDRALCRVFRDIKFDWERQPHSDNYEKFARQFNYEANIVTQNLKLSIQIKAMDAKQRTKAQEKYKQNVFFDNLSCTRLDLDDFTKAVGKRVRMDLDNGSTETTNRDISTFHFHNVTVHKSSNWRCSVTKENVPVMLRNWIDMVGRYKIRPTDVQKVVFFGGKHHHVRSVTTAGNLGLPCPCFCTIEGKRCNVVFDLPKVKDSLIEAFGICEESRLLAIGLLDKIDREIRANKRSFRVKTKCPQCDHEEINVEAELNDTGANPQHKHPSDMTCSNCHYNYCTDCKKEFHKGIICRGFTDDEAGEYTNKFQKAPCCGAPVERVEGCTYIRCGCDISWCWKCRCVRNSENSDTPHYCIVVGQANLNPMWEDNPRVTVYESSAPLLNNGDLLDDFVPL